MGEFRFDLLLENAYQENGSLYHRQAFSSTKNSFAHRKQMPSLPQSLPGPVGRQGIYLRTSLSVEFISCNFM
jgi:hypothetical protein